MREKSKFFLSLVFTIIIVFIAGSAILYIIDKNIPKYLEENTPKRVDFIETQKKNGQSITGSISTSLSNKVWLIVDKKNTKTSNLYESVYFADDFLGTAVVVTNDGWFVSKKIDNTLNIALVNSENKVIDVETVVSDDILGLSYIKVKQNGLNPIGIIDSSSLEVGQEVYVIKPNLYNYQNEIISNSIRNLHSRFIQSKSDLVHKASDVVIYGMLSLDAEEGLPVVNEDSEMVGITYSYEKNTYLLPSKYIRYSLTRLFNNDKNIDYPSLGISYLDLSEVVLSVDLSTKGAYVYESTNSLISKGDIIQKVNNDDLNEIRSLNTLLLDYVPGTEITLTVLRNNKQQDIKVKLQTLKK